MLDFKDVAVRIKKLRGSLSQKKFGEKLGYGQQYVSEIERGARNPCVEILYTMSVQLGVTTDYLLKGEDSRDAPNGDDPQSLIRTLVAEVSDMKAQLMKLTEREIAAPPLKKTGSS